MAEGSTFKTAHSGERQVVTDSCGKRLSVLLMWNSLESSLNVLMTWQLNLSTVTDPREQGRGGTLLYNLALKVTYQHFHRGLLLVMLPNLAQYRRGLRKVLNIKGKNLWEPSWRLATILLVFFFFSNFKFSLYIYFYFVEIWFCTRSLFFLAEH